MLNELGYGKGQPFEFKLLYWLCELMSMMALKGLRLKDRNPFFIGFMPVLLISTIYLLKGGNSFFNNFDISPK